MIDCSHANSGKDEKKQAVVAGKVAKQIADADEGLNIGGVMLESFLSAGRQEISKRMTYGVSVTDACMDWDTTEVVLRKLGEAVRQRRRKFTIEGQKAEMERIKQEQQDL